jgi:hypothetical protein
MRVLCCTLNVHSLLWHPPRALWPPTTAQRGCTHISIYILVTDPYKKTCSIIGPPYPLQQGMHHLQTMPRVVQFKVLTGPTKTENQDKGWGYFLEEPLIFMFSIICPPCHRTGLRDMQATISKSTS